MKIFNLILLLFMFFCCHPRVKNKKDISEVNNRLKVSVNDSLPFWDSSFPHGGSRGYIDTFYRYGDHYRLIHHNNEFDGFVQKLINRTWKNIIVFESLSNEDDYDVGTDINGDGYLDITLKSKWYSDVFFYKRELQSFDSVSLEDYPNRWILLDKSKNIYCSENVGKVEEGTSELYTFQTYAPYCYYKIIFFPNRDGSLKEAILYKCKSGISNDTLRIKKLDSGNEKNITNFKYKEFWEKNLNSLLY